jgi:aryl-alcohol dehydrogenase-like predicted oxidoreductase
MRYSFLADTGVQVSPLALGTMTFGGAADAKTSRAIFDRCREVGINLFDCANVYENGLSEEILGDLVADCRDELLVTSKAFFPIGEDPNAQGASRRHLRQAVEGSLGRLHTDRIDLYFIHRFDGKTGLEETLRALDDLVSEGKILYTAASNFAAWQVEKALGISALRGFVRFKALQPMYNLVKRQAEVEILPMAEAENLAVFPYSPLGGGLLTGKYAGKNRPAGGRLVESEMYQIRYRDTYDTAERFAEFARERGWEPAALAVAWVGSHPAVTAPLIGARNLEQLEGSLAALEIDLTPELRAEISALSPEPPPATDRNDERSESGWLAR